MDDSKHKTIIGDLEKTFQVHDYATHNTVKIQETKQYDFW